MSTAIIRVDKGSSWRFPGALSNPPVQFTTVEGGTLEAMMQRANIVLKDEKGGTATVTIANVTESNGVIYVIDSVLLP